LDFSSSHQQLDGLMADCDAVVEGQIRVDAADAGASRLGAHNNTRQRLTGFSRRATIRVNAAAESARIPSNA
jgi:hypothetical protein